MDLLAALSGLGFGLSLIIAIGAQNAFVLRQGIRGEHVAVVVAICAVATRLLIAGGVAGAGAVLRARRPSSTASGSPAPRSCSATPSRRPPRLAPVGAACR